jgi:hypothetical protein
MAITSCGDWGLTADSRFESWGKKITASGVDLEQEDERSLGGEWVRWDEVVFLGADEYLVVTAEYGGHKNKKCMHRLVRGGDECTLVSSTNKSDGIGISMLIEEWLTCERITEQQYVKAKNSMLYAYALYVATADRRVHRSDVLRDERERLMARIAEIDAELALEKLALEK